MQQDISVLRLLNELEERVAKYESQEVFHAEQEVFHREQRAVCATELVVARERLAAFRAAAEAAGEFVARTEVRRPEVPALEDDLPPGEPVKVSRLAARVIANKASGETFGAASITQEINQRYGKRLRRAARVRTVATALRRMAAGGRIRQLAEGRAYHEGLYTRLGE
jgi:hypothetical protein